MPATVFVPGLDDCTDQNVVARGAGPGVLLQDVFGVSASSDPELKRETFAFGLRPVPGACAVHELDQRVLFVFLVFA